MFLSKLNLRPFFSPDPTEILPGNGNVPPPPARHERLTCEYCECTLTSKGEVLRMSDKAKTFRDHDDVLIKRDRRIAELETQVEEHKRQIAALTPAQREKFGLELL
jgi:hypothetical protein